MHLVIVLYALFASIFTIAKAALEHSSPFFLVGSRMLLAGFLLLGYQAIANPGSVRLRSQHWSYWKKIILLAAFGIYFTNAFEFWGLQYLTSFKTCFIYSLSPFFSALLSFLIFKERLSRKKWLGLLVGFAGFIPIFSIDGTGEQGIQHLFILSWAEIAVIAAAASTVYGWIVLRDLVNSHEGSLVTANGWSMIFGGIFALAHSLCVETWDPIPVTGYVPFIEYALLMILISNCICYNLYGHLLKKYTATFLSFAGFMTPLFSATYGMIFLGEVITPVFFLSALIVFGGLLVFYFEELKEGVSFPEGAEASKKVA